MTSDVEKIGRLQGAALSGVYLHRRGAIKQLGRIPTLESAEALLRIAKEWAEQKEDADDPQRGAARIGVTLAMERMIEEHRKPGPPMSTPDAIRIGRQAMADAAYWVQARPPPPKVNPVPTELIGAALAQIGEPALKAAERWLAIKLHPVVAKVLLAAGEQMGGSVGVDLVRRVRGGFVDDEIRLIADEALFRLRTRPIRSGQTHATSEDRDDQQQDCNQQRAQATSRFQPSNAPYGDSVEPEQVDFPLGVCPHGHGPLKPWEGVPRCWKCGWQEADAGIAVRKRGLTGRSTAGWFRRIRWKWR